MIKEDKEELREIIKGFIAIQDSKFDIIEIKLQQIYDQTKKTNGRVNKLEDQTEELRNKNKEHILLCPNSLKIRTLEDKNLEDQSIKKFIVKSISIAVASISIIITILKILI